MTRVPRLLRRRPPPATRPGSRRGSLVDRGGVRGGRVRRGRGRGWRGGAVHALNITATAANTKLRRKPLIMRSPFRVTSGRHSTPQAEARRLWNCPGPVRLNEGNATWLPLLTTRIAGPAWNFSGSPRISTPASARLKRPHRQPRQGLSGLRDCSPGRGADPAGARRPVAGEAGDPVPAREAVVTVYGLRASGVL